jgi:hypothetical protein
MEKFKGNSITSANTQKLDANLLLNCGGYFWYTYLNQGFPYSLEMNFYLNLVHKGF